MSTDLVMVRGLPFHLPIRIENGKDRWPDLPEVRSQMRVGHSEETSLIANLHPFMTVAYGSGEQANDVLIDWSMTGAQTHAIARGGYYDVVVSEAGTTDLTALRAINGKIDVQVLTTKAAGTT